MGSILSFPGPPEIHYPDSPVYFPVRKTKESEGEDDIKHVGRTSIRDFVETNCKSLFSVQKSPYWLHNGHLQTIWCVFGDFSQIDKVVYERKLIRLTDRGTVGLDFTPPLMHSQDLPEDTPIVVVLHGLTGGSYESYVRSILAPACAPVSEGGLGYRGVVVNFRGCAGVPVTSGQLYSAGQSDDLRQALIYIAHRFPKAPLLGLGFSLGANVLVKYLEEEGTGSRLRTACAVGCPWDLNANNVALNQHFFYRETYSKAMGNNLCNLVKANIETLSKFSEHDCSRQVVETLALKNPTLVKFDNTWTRYLGGPYAPHGPFPFASAEDYYTWASTHERVKGVGVPLLAINAADDPIVQAVPMDAQGNGYCAMALTAQGGHLGWFEYDEKGVLRRWVRKPVLEWLKASVEVLVAENQGREIIEVDGFLKEAGETWAHLGCYELDGGGIIQGTDGEGLGLQGL